MRILALDAALGRSSVAVHADGVLLAEQACASDRGQAGALAPLVQDVLAAAGYALSDLDIIGVCIGPGRFTGLRAAIALAQGLAAGGGLPLVGVTVGEALAVSGGFAGRALWAAVDSRRGRVFLERDGAVAAFDLDALPSPSGPVAIAGDAAVVVAASLAAMGHDVMLTGRRFVRASDVATAVSRGVGRAAQPVYVDPPEAKLPAGGLRPPPAA